MSSTDLSGRDPRTGARLTVTIEGGLVASVRRDDQQPASDLPWLTSGLVDLQVNGFAGFDVNATDVDADQVLGLVRACWQTGVTSVVPTIITASEDGIVTALRAVAAARAADPLVARAVPYVHLEGPHLSDQDGPRGVHAAEHIRPPDVAEFERWQQAGAGLVGIVTVSPHFAEAPDYIAALTRRGVRVAIGHTHASPEQITAAADAGACMSTHLGNGAHAEIRRHPNYIWTQLADDRLAAGFIADGHHLPADTLTAMLRAKGPGRAFLVSDATAIAGRPPGRYRTPVGGEVELSPEGRLAWAGTPLLAGAARSVADGVATVANLGAFGLGTAVELATAVPGRFAGVDRGTIRVGAAADLLRFSWSPGDRQLAVDTVLVAGEPVR